MGVVIVLFNISAAILTFFYVQPLVNEFRLATLATNPEGVLINFVLMLLIPIIWMVILVMSILEIKRAITRGDTQDG